MAREFEREWWTFFDKEPIAMEIPLISLPHEVPSFKTIALGIEFPAQELWEIHLNHSTVESCAFLWTLGFSWFEAVGRNVIRRVKLNRVSTVEILSSYYLPKKVNNWT
jgi:hypothetical protein